MFKNLSITLVALLILSSSASADTGYIRHEFASIEGTTIDTDAGGTEGGLYSYSYNSSALNFNSETLTFYDQALDQYIFLVNITSDQLRVIFMDKDMKVVSNVYYPEKTDALPYQLHSVNFYPSRYLDNQKILPGKIIVETVKGNVVVDLVTRKSQFVYFSKHLFDTRLEEIPIKEIKKD